MVLLSNIQFYQEMMRQNLGYTTLLFTGACSLSFLYDRLTGGCSCPELVLRGRPITVACCRGLHASPVRCTAAQARRSPPVILPNVYHILKGKN
uniref:Uncharacterized protein n=1 Tax=Salix viminalis TaxID=40686 RepID=A0A6N2N4P6_SALVM